ncbi:hypothetical protein AB0N61_00690 [Microbacterium sp. NPDC089320]
MLDGAFFSHAIAWIIGAMTVCAAGLSFAALFALGRSGYRKD